MKLFLFILLIPYVANCQDSLAKYSYPLFSIKIFKEENGKFPFKKGGGTAFFLKNKGKTYLVTAKHCLVPDDSNIQAVERFPDECIIRLEERSGKIILFKFDTKWVKQNYSLSEFNSPDLLAFEFKEADSFKINIIENVMPVAYNIENQKVVSYGFPILDYSDVVAEFEDFKIRKPLLTKGTILNSESLPKGLDSRIVNDSTSFIFKREDSLKKQGASGSPIFIYINNKAYLAGVLTRAGIDNPFTTGVKSKYLLSFFKIEAN